MENPFYQLYDLYGFDIYVDSPVDFFHVAIIGLLPVHVELFYNSLPAQLKKVYNEKYSDFKHNNLSLKPFDSRTTWMGEVCFSSELAANCKGMVTIPCHHTILV